MSIIIRLLILMSIFCIVTSPHPSTSSRLVITFKTRADNILSNADLINATLVKRYGRRLVLDLGRPYNLSEEEDSVRSVMLAVELVELDYLVSVGGNLDYLVSVGNFSESTGSNFDSESIVVVQDLPGDIPPLTQWNLKDSEPYSIHAESVWVTSNSTPNVIVAVIDTGLALPARDYFLNLVDGYDFISDADLALDGDGRDPDATDPGDWGDFCPTSSWHGTRVASILAARHDNKFGMRGVAQNCSVMPVRVLGLCKMGYANDVTDAIVWAAGGNIDGVPLNPLPAKILSLSLAGQGDCPSYLQSAIDLAMNLGSVVVTAAGNNNKDASGYFPANCNGVVAVAASTRQGTLAAYSNYGDSIAVSAPGGDYVNPIMTLKVDALETDMLISYGTGTSFATPHIAGLFSLLFKYTTQFSNWNHNISNALNTSICNNNNVCVKAIPSMDFLKNTVFATVTCNNGNYIWCYRFGDATSGCGACSCQSNTQYYQSCTYFTGCQEACLCNAGFILNGVCISCSPGTYSLLTSTTNAAIYNPAIRYESASNCIQCSAGTYSAAYGSTFCTQWTITTCLAGNYLSTNPSNTANGICSPCPANSYCLGGTNSFVGWTVTTCSAGSYLSTSPSAACNGVCSSCAAGYTSVTASSSCLLCVSGTYSPVIASTLCSQCLIGTFSTVSGAISSATCSGCAAGTFSTALGAVSSVTCTNCVAGTYSLVAGIGSSALCSLCVVGAYSTALGAVSSATCTQCLIGTYSSIAGISTSALCTKCSPGTFSTAYGASTSATCTLCIAGKYESGTGAFGYCTACVAGKYSTASGAGVESSCALCAAGTYSTQLGALISSTCSGCLAGTYSSITGVTACTDCTATSTYSASTGQTACQSCTNDRSCVAGLQMSTCTKTANTACVNCPTPPVNSGWGIGVCNWVCITDYYKNGAACSSCTAFTPAFCATGTYFTYCTTDTNSKCVACTKKPLLNSYYTTSSGIQVDNCDWACNAGFYKSGITCAACDPGTYSSVAGLTSACPTCDTCSQGLYKNGCGGTLSGSCISCTNTVHT